jgi:hypothetical protein
MERKEKERTLIDAARQMLEERGEKTVAPQMNPVVRNYLKDLDEGFFDDPSDFTEALNNFRDDFLFEMFPKEYAQMEAQARAAAQAEALARGPRPQEQMARMPMPIEEIATQAPVRVPEEMRAGGRTSLI